MSLLRSLFSGSGNGAGPRAPLVRIPEKRPRIVELEDEGAFAHVVQQLEEILRNTPGTKERRARIEVVIQITHDPVKPPAQTVEVGNLRIVGIPAAREWHDYAVFWASAWRSSLEAGQPASREKGMPIPSTADLEEARRRAGAHGARTVKRFNVQQR